WNNPLMTRAEKLCACRGLHETFAGRGAWDIAELKQIGFGESYPLHQIGTGDWQKTVQLRYNSGQSKVYWASGVNYTLWGKINALCYAEFKSPDYELETALNVAELWKAVKYGGSMIEEAKAFTRYGYNGSSPEIVALQPTDGLTADPN